MTHNIQLISEIPGAPKAVGPYSVVAKIGNLHFLSGCIALDASGKMAEGGITEQTQQIFDNLEIILASLGGSLENIVKTTVFMTDLTQFATFNDVYGTRLKGHKPARSTVEVSKLPKDAVIEIEAIVSI